MVSKTNLQANCNCTKTVAKLNQKLLGNLIEKKSKLRAFDFKSVTFLSAIQQRFSKSEKLLTILLFKEIKRSNLTQLI
jgi:hypothetical protein